MDLLPPLKCGLGELSPAQSCGRGPARAVGGDFLARGVAQAAPEMPSVGDLDRVRQRVSHGLGIRGRAVLAHDFDSRMGSQPFGHYLGAASGQHVDPGTGVGIDQHGGVVTPSAQGEVIDPQNRRHRVIRQRDAHQDPHSGVPPDRDPESWQQPGGGPASQLTHDAADLLTEPNGASLLSLDHTRHLLPERPARALRDQATHPTDPQSHQYPPSVNRHIRRDPPMEGLNPAGQRPADRARHGTTLGRRPHHARIARVLHALDRQRRKPCSVPGLMETIKPG